MSKYCDFINKVYDVLTQEAATGGSLVTLLAGRVFWQLTDTMNEQLPCLTVGLGALTEEEAASSLTKDGLLPVRITINAMADNNGRPFGYVSGATDYKGIIRIFELVMNALETKGGVDAATRKTMTGTCEFYTLAAEPPVYSGDDHWSMVINLVGHLRFNAGGR